MASAGHGDYLFCFDNTFSIQSDKRVFFELFLLDAQGHFLGGFDQQINVGAEVLRTLDTRVDRFQVPLFYLNRYLSLDLTDFLFWCFLVIVSKVFPIFRM